MTPLELFTTHRSLLKGPQTPNIQHILTYTPTQILEDVILIWYHQHYHKLLYKKLNIKNIKFLKKLTPTTNDPDEFWAIINPLLKQTIQP